MNKRLRTCDPVAVPCASTRADIMRFRTWIQYHPYSFSGADYREMLRDKNDPHGRNYILEHENTRMVFNNPIEDVVNSPFTMMY